MTEHAIPTHDEYSKLYDENFRRWPTIDERIIIETHVRVKHEGCGGLTNSPECLEIYQAHIAAFLQGELPLNTIDNT